jgi:DNA-binding MarR family transcriptional regulator
LLYYGGQEENILIEERLNIREIDANILFHGCITFALVNRLAEDILRKLGLSSGESAVLLHLNAQGKEINLSQVKQNTFLFSGASITKVAEKLMRKGLITRRENPKSRREKLVKITPAGEKLVTKVLLSYKAQYPKVLDNIPSSSKDRLLKDLKTIFNNVMALKGRI